MNVTRDVVLDLLPLYLAGEASPDTNSIVEEFLKHDPELAQRVRGRWMANVAEATPSELPPDLELRTLRRTRRLLGVQRWVFGLAWFFSAIAFSAEASFRGKRLTGFHFLLPSYPVELGIPLALGLACWVTYFGIRRHLRTGAA